MKVKFDEKTQKWIELENNSKDGIYLDGYLKKKLDFVKKILKDNWDAPILIDGDERSGKSTLAMTIGYYISDGKLTEENFASGMNDAAKKIKDLPKGSVLIIDEGSLVFSSKDAMSKGQKQLMKIMDVVGQKNLTIIICLPSFFDLNKQIAVRRSRFLIHVYKDKKTWKRGQFAYYSSKNKKILYEKGRKSFGSYAFPRPNFVASFVDFKPDFYKKYLEIKEKSMIEALESGQKKIEEKDKITIAVGRLKEKYPKELTAKKLGEIFGVCSRTIEYRLKAYREMPNSELAK